MAKELLSIPFTLQEGAGNGPVTNWNTYDDQVQYAVACVGRSFHFLLVAFRTEAEATQWLASKRHAKCMETYEFTRAYVATRTQEA